MSHDDRHPCFNAKAREQHGRVHLPVAPACNVRCNFCNRKFDCANESRPGVTSEVLKPEQAPWYLQQVLRDDPDLSVVGIAGPGDPLANADATLETLRLVHRHHPELISCLATNGLNLPKHAKELHELGATHITVTVNAVDPTITAKVYRFVRDGDEVLRGEAGARRLLMRQLAGIRACVALGMTVKINCIVMPGINEHHVEEVAKAVAELGAHRFNPMALKPVAGTAFGELDEPDEAFMRDLRKRCAAHMPIMAHCARCRADAVGRLGAPNSAAATALLTEASTMTEIPADRPHVAVASREGMLVNQHLGHAEMLLIYAEEADDFRLVDVRQAPDAGGDHGTRWAAMADVVHDCRAVVAAEAGEPPRRALAEHGIALHTTEGLIADALELVFAGEGSKLRPPSCSAGTRCGGGCDSGGGGGLCA
ncbi:MAG: radical SAM protein [Planctomycetota bacterium]|nr:radical SAM protein [Planctomycetota bacterium]